jgi:hypothetical protein
VRNLNAQGNLMCHYGSDTNMEKKLTDKSPEFSAMYHEVSY